VPPLLATCHDRPVITRPFPLRRLIIGDEPSAWTAAGFSVDGGVTRLGSTSISLVGDEEGRGILAAEVEGLVGAIDGLRFAPSATSAPVGADEHDNGATHLDHLVAMSPDMDRTTAALTTAGLEHRRTRTFDAGGSTRRQAFFWLGDVILELVGDHDAHGDGPALLWGLAVTCADLHAAATLLGDHLGAIKPAVQSGREIATLRTRALDISVPIALMSPHTGPAE
jgi:hypothetical protein